MVNSFCVSECINENSHYNFCAYNGCSRSFYDCLSVFDDKPWYVFHQAKIVPANLKYYKGIIDIVKLEGRAAATDMLIRQLNQYIYELDSYEYLYNRFPVLFPFYHPYKIGVEPPGIFEEVTKCDNDDCESCGKCRKMWQGYYGFGEEVYDFIKGYKAYKKADYSTAYQYFEKFIKISSAKSDKFQNAALSRALFYMGVCALSSEKKAKAVEYFLASISRDNSNWDAHTMLGKIYYGEGEVWKAEEELKESIRLNEKEWSSYNVLGAVYREAGRLEEAERMLKEAIRLKEDEWSNHNILGNVYKRMEREEEAVKEYREALKQCTEEEYCKKIEAKIQDIEVMRKGK
ncbi:MAG: tetratricopeptide repeat protein [Elusimicrobia bacterium ADurb.Bin231]|nr:MAG: tetratricopeptide repeat protein [Elusimicrobia bacterium ADurb.Bin231]